MSTSTLLRRLAGTAAICVAALFGSSAALAKSPDPAYAKQQDSTIGQMKGNLAKSAEAKIKLVDTQNC